MLLLFLKTRTGHYDAKAEYDDGRMIVKKGSRVSLQLASHIRGGRKARSYLDDPSYVNDRGIVIQDCEFKSPSTAAQFVTGNSVNGYLVWKNKNGTKLKELLKK